MIATQSNPNLVSIADAAKRHHISRRTIERWIRAGRLDSTVSEADRRKRLVDVTAVEALVTETTRARTAPPPPRAVRFMDGPVDEEEHADADTTLSEAQHYQPLVDNVLQLVYSHYQRLSVQLSPNAFTPLSLDQLRGGPLGLDLSHLAELSDGQAPGPRGWVLEGIDAILDLLFWPVAADGYTVPRSFWDTDLGRFLALVKLRAYEPDELMSVTEAARHIGVSRPTVYQWMDERVLDSVRDVMSGRTLVVRRDVEKVLRFRRVFEESAEES